MIGSAGKGIGNVFKAESAQVSSNKPEPLPSPEPLATQGDHALSFGVIYANAIAASEIDRSTRKFPVGSILVRERLDSSVSVVPTAVIAMVKRKSGFSRDSGDWEFIALNGSDMKLMSRQTVGQCAACHTKASNTDWVFVDQFDK